MRRDRTCLQTQQTPPTVDDNVPPPPPLERVDEHSWMRRSPCVVVHAYFNPELPYIPHRLPAGRINVHAGSQGVHAHTIHVAMMMGEGKMGETGPARDGVACLQARSASFLLSNALKSKTTTKNWKQTPKSALKYCNTRSTEEGAASIRSFQRQRNQQTLVGQSKTSQRCTSFQ